jgi:hypothetical protein
MPKFSLLAALDKQAAEDKNKDPNAPNIVYERYEIDVRGKPMGVLIPEREVDNFEATLSEAGEISSHQLTKIVRAHRGIVER